MGTGKMCKICCGEKDGAGLSGKCQNAQLRMTFQESGKKGKKGEHKGLSWKQAIQQTAFLEDQERDRLLNGWPWSMAIRMEHGIKMEEKEKQRLKTENQT